MVLLVDVGNTSIVLGFAENHVIEKNYRFKTSTDKTADEYYIFIDYSRKDTYELPVTPVYTTSSSEIYKSRCSNLYYL